MRKVKEEISDTICMKAVGIIHSPFKDPVNMPVQPKGGINLNAKIEIFPEYAEGLDDLSEFSHIYLIYHFHKTASHKIKVMPFNEKENVHRGVFATRTPVHPNSIGLSVVELVEVSGNTVTIRGVDVLDGTPLLDIKPYIENFDKIEGETRSGWMRSSLEEVSVKRSDGRFV